VEIDLPAQTIKAGNQVIGFEIEPHIKKRLVEGLDDIQITLEKYLEKIRSYEEGMPRYLEPRPRSFLHE
jgi:3-isopropylmalate/(R)-2-methylmalate dehydratase small subunit